MLSFYRQLIETDYSSIEILLISVTWNVFHVEIVTSDNVTDRVYVFHEPATFMKPLQNFNVLKIVNRVRYK